MTERPKSELVPAPPDELEHPDVERAGFIPARGIEEPPVVARLVVEIRSDGTRTIARGAIDDAHRGERVAIEARGDSPIQLALALARALTQIPRITARTAVRGLLGRRRDK